MSNWQECWPKYLVWYDRLVEDRSICLWASKEVLWKLRMGSALELWWSLNTHVSLVAFNGLHWKMMCSEDNCGTVCTHMYHEMTVRESTILLIILHHLETHAYLRCILNSFFISKTIYPTSHVITWAWFSQGWGLIHMMWAAMWQRFFPLWVFLMFQEFLNPGTSRIGRVAWTARMLPSIQTKWPLFGKELCCFLLSMFIFPRFKYSWDDVVWSHGKAPPIPVVKWISLHLWLKEKWVVNSLLFGKCSSAHTPTVHIHHWLTSVWCNRHTSVWYTYT